MFGLLIASTNVTKAFIQPGSHTQKKVRHQGKAKQLS